MCFSPTASFTSAALLISAGTVTTLGNRKKEQYMIAAVPLLFGVQQLSEGIIWYTAGDAAATLPRQLAITSFMLFAHAVWPSVIPWSIHNVERDASRKNYLPFYRLQCGFSSKGATDIVD